MGKSRASAPAGGSGARSGGSWRRRPRTPVSSSSLAGSDSTWADIFISSGDEEDQQPRPPPSTLHPPPPSSSSPRRTRYTSPTMGKSWASAPAGGSGAGSGSSWRRRPRTPGSSSSLAGGDSTWADIFISSGDEEDQQPRPPQSVPAVPGQVYAGINAEFEELMLRHSFVHTNGPTLPPGVLLPVKRNPASPPRSPPPAQQRRPNRTPRQGRVALTAVPTHHERRVALAADRRALKVDRRSPSPRRVVKEERRSSPSPPAQCARAHSALPPRRLLLHVIIPEHHDCAGFVDSDVPPPHIAVDPDLAYAWALDRSVTTSETAKRRLRRLNWEMARYGEDWSPAEIAAAVKDDASNDRRPLPQSTSSVATAALRTGRRRWRGSSTSARRPPESHVATPPPSAVPSPTTPTPTAGRVTMMEEEQPASPTLATRSS
nr:serine/arginine repetitive matrix protein 1-like [Aegilops tauschii subsp. strangulata]